MDCIDEAITSIDLREEGASFSYRKVAREFKVDGSTLSRGHQGKTSSNAGEAQQRSHLTLQQEQELVNSIQGLQERGLLPTRSMVQLWPLGVAKVDVSARWFSRFFARNSANLTSKWTTGIDCNRYKADSRETYSQYFQYLHKGMQEYEVEAENVYNMNEKGFMLGTTGCSKRVFSKRLWQQKRTRYALQDGSREWITVLGCCCADGSALDPVLIFQGISGIQSSWVREVEAGEHLHFCRKFSLRMDK
jgi:hypothetical protein